MTLTLESAIENIRREMLRTTAHDTVVGERWYGRMRVITHGHSARLGISPLNVAGVYAAHSTNTQWNVNLILAGLTLRGKKLHRGTLGMNIDKAANMMAGADITTLVKDVNNYKLRAFASACAGNMYSVVVDRWACAIAWGWEGCPYNGDKYCARNGKGHACANSRVPSGDEYNIIAEAYSVLADEMGMLPAILQATTWVAARNRK
jgi:hypothetical protein